MINPITKLLDHAHERPDELALVGPNLDLTWSELAGDVRRVAAWLRDKGLQSGDMALLDLSPETEVIAMLALLHEGAASAHYSENLSQLDLAAMGFKFLITRNSNANVPGVQSLFLKPEEVSVLNSDSLIEPKSLKSEDQIIRVIFSSGTTGSPKAIPFSAAQTFARSVVFEKEVIAGGELISILSHDVSLGYITLMSDMFRGRRHFTAGPLLLGLKSAGRFNVDRLAISPIGLREITEAVQNRVLTLDWNVRHVFTAGGPVSTELAERATNLLGVELTSIYGSTEVGLVAMRKGVPEEDSSAGEILKHVYLEIVDENGSILEDGDTGLVRMKVEWQASEYLNDSNTSKDYFRDGYFYPGDIGSKIGGDLYIKGRSNLVMNLGGVKIDPIKVENLIMHKFKIQDVVLSLNHILSPPVRLILPSSLDIDEQLLITTVEKDFRLEGKVGITRIADIPRNSMGKPNRQYLAQVIGE